LHLVFAKVREKNIFFLYIAPLILLWMDIFRTGKKIDKQHIVLVDGILQIIILRKDIFDFYLSRERLRWRRLNEYCSVIQQGA